MSDWRIILSTTRQWNPGDEFIAMGVERLLRQVVNVDSMAAWNRNPDLFIDEWRDSTLRPDFLTNSLRDPALLFSNLVVAAGSPEWCGGPMRRLYEEIAQKPDIPFLVVGAGGGSLPFRPTPLDEEVLRRKNTWISTRSEVLAQQINEYLGEEKAIPIPCPAFFSGCPSELPSEGKNGRIGLIVQSTAVRNQSIGDQLYQQITDLLSKDSSGKIDIICFYQDEYSRFQALFGNTHRVIYHYASDRLLGILSRYNAIVSTRLHGAIGALSLGVPSRVICESENQRITSTLCLFPHELLASLPVDDAISWAKQQLDQTDTALPTGLLEFRNQTEATYLTLLRRQLNCS